MTDSLLSALLDASERLQQCADRARAANRFDVLVEIQNGAHCIAKALIAELKSQAPTHNTSCICGHRRGNHTVPGSECAHVHCDCAAFVEGT